MEGMQCVQLETRPIRKAMRNSKALHLPSGDLRSVYSSGRADFRLCAISRAVIRMPEKREKGATNNHGDGVGFRHVWCQKDQRENAANAGQPIGLFLS